MKRIGLSLLKSLLLLLSIPVLYWTGYKVASLFHTPGVEGGNVAYGLTLHQLLWVLVFSIPAIVFLHDFRIKKEKVTVWIHLCWFVALCLLTTSTLAYQPYEFGLLLACIGSTIVTRVLLDRAIDTRKDNGL